MSNEVGNPEPSAEDHRTLLGRLAWRSKLDEPFATDALAVLLEQSDIRSSFLSYLQGRYRDRGIELDLLQVSRIDARVDDKDFGTPDLVGFDNRRQPILVIEAKFDHHLAQGQVMNYLQFQRRDVTGSQFALVLLVPRYKVDAAAELGRDVATQMGIDESMVLAISWQEVLDIVEIAAVKLGLGHRSYSADVAQLRDFVEERTRSGLGVLAEALSIANWDANVSTLVSLAKRASKRVADERGASLEGTAHLDVYGYGPARYVLEGDRIFWTLGPHKAFASQGDGPLWLRFNSATGIGPQAVQEIRSLLANNGDWTLRDDEGHLWVRIEIDEVWDEALAGQVVDRVVAQVLDVLEVGLPRPVGIGEDQVLH